MPKIVVRTTVPSSDPLSTPQAVDDILDFDLANVDDYIQILIAQLLGNDKGGEAKTFYDADDFTSDGTAIIYDQANQVLNIDADAYAGLAAGEESTITFNYTIRLSNGTLSTAQVTMTLVGENEGPVAQDMQLSTSENQTLTDVLFQSEDIDSDDNQASLTYIVVDQPSAGSLTVTGNKFSFDPGTAFDYLGADESTNVTFTYQAKDQHGALSNVKTVTITVNGANDGPTADDMSVGITENQTATDVLFVADDVDSDDDQASLTYLVVDQPSAGFVTVNGSKFSFEPGTAFDHLMEGDATSVTFTYQARDTHGALSEIKTVTVNVTGTNDAPVAEALSAAVSENGTYMFTGAFTDPDVGDAHTYSVDTTGTIGSVTQTHSNFLYDPGTAFDYLSAGETATDTFQYTVKDYHGAESTETVTVTIMGQNDDPEVQDIRGEVTESGTTKLTAQWTDVDASDSHTFSVNTDGTVGAVTENGDGTFGYDTNGQFECLAAGETATDTFQYTVYDGQGGVVTNTATVTITGENDLSEVVASDGDSSGSGELPMPEGDGALSASGTLTVQDPDISDVLSVSLVDVTYNSAQFLPDGVDLLSLFEVGIPTDTSLTESGKFTWSFNAPAGMFDYLKAGDELDLYYHIRPNDGHVANANGEGTVTIKIVGTNDAPTLVHGLSNQTSPEDAPFSFTIPAGTFTDPDSTLTYTATLADGTTALPSWLLFDAETQTFSGTPQQNFNGVISVKVTASDGSLSASDTFDLTITPVNDAPITQPSEVFGAEDMLIAVTLLGSDVESPVQFQIDTLPTDGVLYSDSNGSTPVISGETLAGPVYFQPTKDFNGDVSFSYRTIDSDQVAGNLATATIHITSVNDAPVAEADTAAVLEDSATEINVVSNDSDVDGDNLGPVNVTQGAHGTTSVNPDGTIHYVPDADYAGEDTFSYTVNDGTEDGNAVEVQVTVTGVNDAPVASNVSASGDEDTVIPFTLTATDIDGPVESFRILGPVQGTLHLNESDSGPGLTPGQSIFATGNSVTVYFKPDANFNGPVSFDYVANDGSADSEPAHVAISVQPGFDAPVAGPDQSLQGTEDTGLAVTLTGSDVDGTVTSYIVSSITHGRLYTDQSKTVEITASTTVPASNATLWFEPDANYNGPAEIAYTAIDNEALASVTPAKITVEVAPVNDAPVTREISITVDEDQWAQPFYLGATDPDGDTVTYDYDTMPSHGGIMMNKQTGYIEYHTPVFQDTYQQSDYNGPDSFTYKAIDSHGVVTIGTVNVTINPVNDAPRDAQWQGGPYVGSDSYAANEDTALVIDAAHGVLSDDTDPEGDAFMAVLASGPQHGSLILNADGSFNYTPNADYSGADSFSYKPTEDGGTYSGAPITVNLTVNPVNDAPVFATNTGGETNATKILFAENTTTPVTTVHATDVDGDTVTYSIGANPDGSYDNGFFKVDPTTGVLSFINPPDFEFTDPGNDDLYKVQVTANDGHGGTATRDVWVQVTDVAQSFVYKGSYRVSDGAYWGNNPPVFSAKEAAALIFGGSASDYVISVNSSHDPSTITGTGWYDGWGKPWTVFDDDFKEDAPPSGYAYPVGDAWSAYVSDHVDYTKVNYVWEVLS